MNWVLLHDVDERLGAIEPKLAHEFDTGAAGHYGKSQLRLTSVHS